MKRSLVILAAGLGSRYGGLKQLEGVGPCGECIMDYSVHDAYRAGFDRVVFVIRPDMADDFRSRFGSRYTGSLTIDYALQLLEDLPVGHAVPPIRTRPWGTGHAVLAAARLLSEPFAVVNADDFYGADAFRQLASFLCGEGISNGTTCALIGYRLGDTLPPTGLVNRGICQCSPDMWLEGIVETIGIRRAAAHGRFIDAVGDEHVLDGRTLVSMNAWAFPPNFGEWLTEEFIRFLAEHGSSPSAEFFLPSAVRQLMARGRVRVKVLPSRDRWCGITNKEDLEEARRSIGALVEQGAYPEKLWP